MFRSLRRTADPTGVVEGPFARVRPARSCIQPCSSDSWMAPASFNTEIAHPRSVGIAARLSFEDSDPHKSRTDFGKGMLSCSSPIASSAKPSWLATAEETDLLRVMLSKSANFRAQTGEAAR